MALCKLWTMLTGIFKDRKTIEEGATIKQQIPTEHPDQITKDVPSSGNYPKFLGFIPPQDAEQAIPKIFHTICMEPGCIGAPRLFKNAEALKKLHFGREFRFWKAAEVAALIQENYLKFRGTFESYDCPVKMNEVARILILHHYGGVYLDQDFIPLRNIEPLLKESTFVIGSEDKDLTPVDGFIAAVAKSPILGRCIELLDRPQADLSELTVREALKTAIEEILALKEPHSAKEGENIRIYSKVFFYLAENESITAKQRITVAELKRKFPNTYLFKAYGSVLEDD